MTLLHCHAGAVRVRLLVTRMPQVQYADGVRSNPTVFKVQYGARWLRVWQHEDGSRYVTHWHNRMRVTELPPTEELTP